MATSSTKAATTAKKSPAKAATSKTKAASTKAKAAPAKAKVTTTRKPSASAKTAKAPAAKAAPRKATAGKKTAAANAKNTPSPEQRYRMIQEAAYFLAERNGFAGNAEGYWVEAEIQISRLLSGK